MGNCICCTQCLEVFYRKLVPRSESEGESLLQNSTSSQSFIQDLDGRDCGSRQYGTLVEEKFSSDVCCQGIFEEQNDFGYAHDSEEDEGICECGDILAPRAFCSDLPAGMRDLPDHSPSLLAYAPPNQNFAERQLQGPVITPDLTAEFANSDRGTVQRQRSIIAPDLGTSFEPLDNSKDLQLANQCHGMRLEQKDREHSSGMTLMNGDGAYEHRIEVEPKQNGHDVGEQAEDGSEQEVIVIQDTGFTVKIQAPGIEPFSIQVSPQEMVQEIHQVLMDREDTCHRTCFSLQLDGNVLDNFAELKTIEGFEEGSVLKVVEEPYTVREARIHVRHIRDLLKSLDPSDAFNGVDCNSLSFLSIFTDGDLGDNGKKKKKGAELEQIDCTPPENILPGSKERPLCTLQPQNKDWKPLQCLKVFTMSGWNPPPGNRKMHGDLMYLYVITMEDRHVSITASTRGFYLNQSTAYNFNPKPANPSFLSHSLVELLNQVSAIFKKNFAALQKKRVQRHPFERIATPFQLYTWTAPQVEHAMDCVRAEDAYTSRLGYEEHIPGQSKQSTAQQKLYKEQKEINKAMIRGY
ncbi:clustered mitochondria protein homolog [Pseudophryne corroboree]|uniref:clustered mitochondria protein homolog n=1 Tax=Pseudophryne corroboree TaxID=495146 RepID=UPI00308187D4